MCEIAAFSVLRHQVLAEGLTDCNWCRRQATGVQQIQEMVSDNAAWTQVLKQQQDFGRRCTVLYKLLKYASGRGHYQELFVLLDMNDYYSTKL